MASKWLKFFGKDGAELNLELGTDGVFRGTVYLDRVSVGLVENQNIFVVEEVLAPSATFVCPLPDNYLQPSQPKIAWRATWKNSDTSEGFWLYTVDSTGEVPYIVENQEVAAPLFAIPYTRNVTTGQATISASDIKSSAVQFNVAFSSPDEYVFDRVLVIEDLSPDNSPYVPSTIAEITFHCETEAEDERLGILLENVGRRLAPGDELIMRDSDIKEGLVDWTLLNEKRKELLVAGEEIYPYIGSYKGLVNILRFFGYQDLRIKEYWLNVDMKAENFGKMAQVQVDNVLEDPKAFALNSQFVDSPSYRKTSLFGLFYDLTQDTGQVDAYGVPVMTNASTFTNEEVLIKLYGLKQRLETDFMPSNAKIYDITGEGVYFVRYGTVSWTDRLKYVKALSGLEFDFNATTPTTEYVRDLRRFQIRQYSPGLDLPVDGFDNLVSPYTYGQAYPPYAIQSLVDSIGDWYDNIGQPAPYHGEQVGWFGDNQPGVIAGMPVVLEADFTAFVWDDMEAAWDGTAVYGLTWATINTATSYEIGWKIEKTGDLPYKFYVRGPIADYTVLPHFLPYAGAYKVTMYVFDLYGGIATTSKEAYLTAKSKEVEVSAIARWRLHDFYNWDMKDAAWDDLAGSTWTNPTEAATAFNSPTEDWEMRWANYRDQYDAQILINGQYLGLQAAIAAGGNNRNNPARRFGTYMLTWENMDLPWDELWHSPWNYFDYHGDVLGGFRVYNPQPGDTIQIDNYPVFTFQGVGSPAVITLAEAVDQLQADDNPGLRYFRWHEVAGSPGFIQASAEELGAMGWHFVSYTNISSPGGISGDTYSWKYPSWLPYQSEYQALFANIQANWPAQYPNVNFDHLFLDMPLADFISGAGYSYQYYLANGSVGPDNTSPADLSLNGYTRGHLPSWTGSGMFQYSDTRLFKDSFACPLGAAVFFVSEHSEVPGKTDVRWRIVNDLTGEVLIDCYSKYLIYNFLEESEYTIECQMKDCNGNQTSVVRKGFVASMDKQSYQEAVATGFAGLTADAITATSAQAGMLSF